MSEDAMQIMAGVIIVSFWLTMFVVVMRVSAKLLCNIRVHYRTPKLEKKTGSRR